MFRHTDEETNKHNQGDRGQKYPHLPKWRSSFFPHRGYICPGSGRLLVLSDLLGVHIDDWFKKLWVGEVRTRGGSPGEEELDVLVWYKNETTLWNLEICCHYTMLCCWLVLISIWFWCNFYNSLLHRQCNPWHHIVYKRATEPGLPVGTICMQVNKGRHLLYFMEIALTFVV